MLEYCLVVYIITLIEIIYWSSYKRSSWMYFISSPITLPIILLILIMRRTMD